MIVYRKNSSATFKETYHAHAEMEFLYVHEGYGTLIIDQQTYSISPGHFIIFQPFQLHRMQMIDTVDSPFIRSLFLFEPSQVEEHLRIYPSLYKFFRHLYMGQLVIPLVEIPDDKVLIQLLQSFFRIRKDIVPVLHEETEYHFMTLFLRYIMPIWQKEQQSLSHRASRKPERIELILNWLENHFREPFRLANLSEEFYMSPSRISHLFKEMTGTSITGYITSRRIREACLLLKSTELSVREVGELVGITNCSHFCYMFKRMTGQSPYQFRNSIARIELRSN